MTTRNPRERRGRAALRAAAVILPVWLHISWLVVVVPPLAIFVTPAVLGWLNAAWFLPVGFALYGSARKWVGEWAIWAFVVLPYGLVILWAAQR